MSVRGCGLPLWASFAFLEPVFRWGGSDSQWAIGIGSWRTAEMLFSLPAPDTSCDLPAQA